MIKAPKFLHPLEINPFPPPNIHQLIVGSSVITFLKLDTHLPIQIHQIIDIDLNPFTVAKYFDKLVSVCDLNLSLALL